MLSWAIFWKELSKYFGMCLYKDFVNSVKVKSYHFTSTHQVPILDMLGYSWKKNKSFLFIEFFVKLNWSDFHLNVYVIASLTIFQS